MPMIMDSGNTLAGVGTIRGCPNDGLLRKQPPARWTMKEPDYRDCMDWRPAGCGPEQAFLAFCASPQTQIQVDRVLDVRRGVGPHGFGARHVRA